MAKGEMVFCVQPLIAEGAEGGKRADIDHGSCPEERSSNNI
jgi:hypothetical protein